MKYEYFYKKLTGFSPYKFQREVFKELSGGNGRIILQAPTGAGKTLATICPFLFFKQYNSKKFPSKLIYSLPLRTLANSIKEDIVEMILENNLKQRISIQTGEAPTDPKFLNEIVFTTIDQSLSSYLNIPVGLSQRSANLNAGAILSSYLVFDEVHLLEADKSLFTMINLLKTTLMPFVIMTATLPQSFIKYLQKELNAKYINVVDEDIEKIDSQKDRKLKVRTHEEPLDTSKILNIHNNKTIVLCNTVKQSQQIYQELKNKKKSNTEIALIHSRFLGEDRKRKEEVIKEWFGKKSKYEDKILVATQVIEAGIDISCDIMHSEVAPIDSLLQRLGRCARYKGEQGIIHIWDSGKYSPYDRTLCKNTFQTVKAVDELYVKDAQELQDKILSEHFKEITKTIDDRSSPKGLQLIYRTMDTSEKSNYRDLIRDINSISIIIHTNPDTITNPYEYESISINPATLVSYLYNLTQSPFIDEDWKIKSFEYSIKERIYKLKDIHIDNLSWKELDKLIQNEFIIVLNSNLAFYSKESGFLLEPNNRKVHKFEKIADEHQEREDFSYTAETWIEHVINVYNTSFNVSIPYPTSQSSKQTFNFRAEIDFALDQYATTLNIDRAILDEALNLTLVLHDYGKLEEKWQYEARTWMINEKKFDPEKVKKICYGHTEFESKKDKRNPNKPNFPSHAGVSAVGVTPFLLNYFNKVLFYSSDEIRELITKVIISAIARHHSPTIENIGTSNRFKVEEKSKEQIEEIIKLGLLKNGFSSNYFTEEDLYFDRPEIDLNTDYLLQAQDSNKKEYYHLYQIFVRILRLSDSYSFTQI